jgi:pyruvate formate lyase activating enzyme
MSSNPKARLGLKSHPARHWKPFNDEKVECNLCPRHCKIPEGGVGFCQVRANEDSKLVTLNYGVSVEMTQEFIETEAVNHYNPGASILSLGNIGCMMACDFCHNWQTSQVKYLDKRDLHFYTPEQVVETALSKGIGMLSWTYNDPVVWQEFVVDTAKLARKHGIKNLYKSAFYISPAAIDELHEVIDIFSLSMKSMDPVFYQQITKGKLQPVLDGIKQVYAYGDRHLELSSLVVTGRNDNHPEMRKTYRWILENLDENVPLHIVRFHPDFKYTSVERTSIPFLIEAREEALQMGLKNVYLGNVYQQHDGLHTNCSGCGNRLVSRFGLNVDPSGVDEKGCCKSCGKKSTIRMEHLVAAKPVPKPASLPAMNSSFSWHGDINACHVIMKNETTSPVDVFVEAVGSSRGTVQKILLRPSESWRMIASKSQAQETGVKAYYPAGVDMKFLPVLDRAHFPTPDQDRHPE